MRILIALTIVASFCLHQQAVACGGGSSRSSGNGSRGSLASLGSQDRVLANAGMQLNAMRQRAAIQAAERNAKLQPIRLANAQRVRAEKVARREARKQVMLAKMEAKKRETAEFLANARTWTDSSGDYETQAVFVDANESLVRMRKQDGAVVDVPINRLSSPDRIWIATNVRPTGSNAVMLAGF